VLGAITIKLTYFDTKLSRDPTEITLDNPVCPLTPVIIPVGSTTLTGDVTTPYRKTSLILCAPNSATAIPKQILPADLTPEITASSTMILLFEKGGSKPIDKEDIPELIKVPLDGL